MDKLIKDNSNLTDMMEHSVAEFRELAGGFNEKMFAINNVQDSTDPNAMNTVKQIATEGINMLREWQNKGAGKPQP